VAEPPASFRPLRPATRAQRKLMFVLGPVIWLVAALLLAIVVDGVDAVENALLILAVCFACALVVLGLTRISRGRREREG
jgi:hypothetical protein